LLTARGKTPVHNVAKVSLDGIETGAKVSTMGHPFGLWYSYSTGDIASVRELDLDPAAIYVQTTAPTSPGNSGCGLFDRKGRLIGIGHAIIPTGSNLAFYIHAKHIHALLKGQGLV
jgi:serine protease Do